MTWFRTTTATLWAGCRPSKAAAALPVASLLSQNKMKTAHLTIPGATAFPRRLVDGDWLC